MLNPRFTKGMRFLKRKLISHESNGSQNGRIEITKRSIYKIKTCYY